MIKQRNVDSRDPNKLEALHFGLGSVSATITALPFFISPFRAVLPSIEFFYTAASASGSIRVQISDSTTSTLIFDSGVVSTSGTGGGVKLMMNTLNPHITYIPTADSQLGQLPLVNQGDTCTMTVTPVTATYTSAQIMPQFEGI